MGEGRIWRTREEKINSTQTETKWVAGDGERLSGLGLLRSTDIYRVADRSSPSSPWKVQTHTDPQRKCYGWWINALSYPSACLPSILVCYGCHSRLCACPVSCLSFTTEGRFPTWLKNFPACCVCPRPTFVCAERPWQTDRYVERCGNPGRRKAAETSLIRVEQSPGFWPQQGNSPPPPQPPCHVRPTASHTNTKYTHKLTHAC